MLIIEPAIIAAAFLLGLASYLLRLPPLVGFLIAGFVLHALGYQNSILIEQLASLGVTLLLFTIGLKLKISDLVRKEIWGNATIHLIISLVLFSLFLLFMQFLQLPLMEDLNLHGIFIIAFALSFSSTVFAVKVLEEKGQMQAVYGRLAIGILIMQDIFAVVFMTVSSGKSPSLWAFSLLLLPFLRPFF